MERKVIPMPKQTHLTLQDRLQIQADLATKTSFREIARRLAKDPTTIAKEIKRNRNEKKIGYHSYNHNDCQLRKTCAQTNICQLCDRYRNHRCSFCGKCRAICRQYLKEECFQLTRPPYVCNACPTKLKCSLTKRFYDANLAHQTYRKSLTEARSGLCFTESEVAQINALVSPLLKQRQSIHHVITHNPDLIPCCERTLYTLVDAQKLAARNLDLARKVRMSPRKKSKEVKIDRKCRVARTYIDFQAYLTCNGHPGVVQMDTVEGVKGASNLLTLYFETSGLMLAFKRPVNNSLSVIHILNELESTLSSAVFARLFEVILTDNGTEFSNPAALEFGIGDVRRSHVFYCDPSSPYQKGAIERNHEFIRMIIPKGVNFDLFSQAQIDTMMNHINSYARKRLNDKCPAYAFSQLESSACLASLGITIIPPSDIHLTPLLLTK
jgi:IS30 family transposase